MSVLTLDAETTGTDPLVDRIVLMGLQWDDEPLIQFTDETEDGAKESTLLRHAADAVAQADRVVTFSGRTFDFPMVHGRAMRHGVKLGYDVDPMLVKYKRRGPHLDMADILTNWNWPKKGWSLERICDCLGVPYDVLPGLDIVKAVAAKAWDDVRKKNAGDLAATHALYQRALTVGLI